MTRLAAFVTMIVLTITLAPDRARAAFADDLHGYCTDTAKFLGTDPGPCEIGRPRTRHRTTRPLVPDRGSKTHADADLKRFDAVGTLTLELSDGTDLSCPAALVAADQLLTTSACGDRLARGATSKVVDQAVVGLGFGKGGAKLARAFQLRLSPGGTQVRTDGKGLSLATVPDGQSGPAPAVLPERAPASGTSMVVIDADTGEVRRRCEAGPVLDEDESSYAYSCPVEAGRPRPKPGSLVFAADDLALVGVTSASAVNGTMRFSSVRALLTTPHVGQALASDGRRVVACFNAGGGRWTIREMFDCSGVWVTPRALLRCSLATECPAILDSPVGRAELDAVLAEEKLSIDSVLAVDVRALPSLPTASSVSSCKSSSTAEADFTKCVLDASTSPDLRGLETCVAGKTGVDQARCITSRTGDARVQQVVDCLEGATPTAAAILACSNDAKANQTLQQIQGCANGQTNGAAVAGCLFATAPAAQGVVAKCLADPTRDDKVGCLDAVSPDYATAKAVVDCLHGAPAQDLGAAVSCVNLRLPGEVGRTAACLGNPDRETATACLLPNKPEVRAAEQVYRCASEGRSTAALIENCTQGLGLDPKAQQALACTARAGDDASALLGCAAQTALPPEAARLVGCAGTSQGPTDFALCASGPLMNEEWRIAAECAVESGGQPYATAGCAATRLTVREITKCFKGQIGKDCFGPNNTIVKALISQFDDVVHGPGKNNEVVKALAALNEGVERISPTAAAFIERPLGSDHALIPKARDDLLNGLHVGGTGRKIIENPFQPRRWF